MTPEEKEIFEKKLYDALIVWKATNEFTDDLSILFLELIEHVFNKRMPIFPSDEVRNDCKVAAYLACFDNAKKYYNPDFVHPRTGKKTNPRLYLTTVIRCSLAGSYVKEMKKRKHEKLKP